MYEIKFNPFKLCYSISWLLNTSHRMPEWHSLAWMNLYSKQGLNIEISTFFCAYFWIFQVPFEPYMKLLLHFPLRTNMTLSIPQFSTLVSKMSWKTETGRQIIIIKLWRCQPTYLQFWFQTFHSRTTVSQKKVLKFVS